MKLSFLSLIAVVLLLLLAVSSALAYTTLEYPQFTVPSSISCSATSHPQYCVTAGSQSYNADAQYALSDGSKWDYAEIDSGWADADELMSMCVGNYESQGGYVYQLGDNGSGSGNNRFDYGYLQVNSQHIFTYGFDPYYLMTSPGNNVSAAYTVWSAQYGGGWGNWSAYTAYGCNSNNYAEFQWVGSPTCSYDLNYGWGVWSNDNVWVWYLGYAGDGGNGIAGMFCP